MIDETTFRNWWALLCERFGREASKPLMQAYYRSLSPRLTTEQFEGAASGLFSSAEFFPKPDDFVDAGAPGQSPEAEALEAWEAVHDLMRGFGSAEDLTDEGRRVVRMLGGERKLRQTKLTDVPFVRRDFLKLYGQAAAVGERERPRLVRATEEGRRVTAELMAGAKDDE